MARVPATAFSVLLGATTLTAGLPVGPPAAASGDAPPSDVSRTGSAGEVRAPTALQVQVAHTGLEIPWDLAFINSAQYLLTERPGRLWLGNVNDSVPLRRVSANLGDLWVSGESGLMGLAVDPRFASNRLFYTCQTHTGPAGGPNDVRVVRWRLAGNGASATRVGQPVVRGIPRATYHTGCRILVGPDQKLWVSTGDAGTGTVPQNRSNLGGKILRVNTNGSIPANNPCAGRSGPIRYVWNWGHRNPQGLALRPGTWQVYNSEHGPSRDDEINRVLRANNYGWDPVYPGGGGYNQNVPMTDTTKFPNAARAIWSSGAPTIATSGMDFVAGGGWGGYTGNLFVALLKDSGVMAVRLNSSGAVTGTSRVPELAGTYGRLRTVRRAPDGALYVLTSNGGGTDRVLRVTPN